AVAPRFRPVGEFLGLPRAPGMRSPLGGGDRLCPARATEDSGVTKIARDQASCLMDIATLIHTLSQPDAYPERVESVEDRQTHISVVFLAGAHAYKVKKPVELGFLDFRTLASRKHFCEEEVRLNRRLAPGVYLGVVPVTSRDGKVQIEGSGEVIDWAVKMQ